MGVEDQALDDAELRDLVIDVLRAETERDKQDRIGASDLANQCDRCLAAKLQGIKRPRPIQTERVWLGAVLGTAIHGELEKRILAHSSDPFSPLLARIIGSFPETKYKICDIKGYGPVYGTIDWSLPTQIVDFKGSTRKKSAVLRDLIAMVEGDAPPFGPSHRDIAGPGQRSLSQAAYEGELDAMSYKVGAYATQLSLYGLARERAGRGVRLLSIVWINRDGTGYFDLPHGQRYDDPKAVHDIWVQSFLYDRAFALRAVARGQWIFDQVTAGRPLDEFESGKHCFICQNDAKDKAAADSAPSVIHFGDIEVAA